MKSRIATLAFIAACDACAGSATLPGEEHLGTLLQPGRNEASVSIESRDGTLAVVVSTFGDGCDAVGRTEVEVRGSLIEITPWDTRAAGPCVDMLLVLRHAIRVAVSAPRPWTIIIRGQTRQNGPCTSVTRVVE